MITIQEILGTDSIAASRLTINSNFLLVENEINDLENTFNINVITGAMDISQASSGQLKAKTVYANQSVFPASGTPTIQFYGTGASAGNGTLAGTLAAKNVTASAATTTATLAVSGASAFTGASVHDGIVTFNDDVIIGQTATKIEKNTTAVGGLTNAFTAPIVGSTTSGVLGTYSNPYALTLTENVIYADCGYVSTNSLDSGDDTGFFFYVSLGSATPTTLPTIPQGYRLTIVNTSNEADIRIRTGIIGSIGSEYYTGFNTTSHGGYTDLVVPTSVSNPTNYFASYPAYKSSVTLQWENRIGKGQTTQNGSWVIVAASGFKLE